MEKFEKILRNQKQIFIKNLEKAFTEGVYVDNPVNRKLGRVGMSYKEWTSKQQKQSGEDKKEKDKKGKILKIQGIEFKKYGSEPYYRNKDIKVGLYKAKGPTGNIIYTNDFNEDLSVSLPKEYSIYNKFKNKLEPAEYIRLKDDKVKEYFEGKISIEEACSLFTGDSLIKNGSEKVKDIEKAFNNGGTGRHYDVYQNNYLNRKLGRVGQPYPKAQKREKIKKSGDVKVSMNFKESASDMPISTREGLNGTFTVNQFKGKDKYKALSAIFDFMKETQGKINSLFKGKKNLIKDASQISFSLNRQDVDDPIEIEAEFGGGELTDKYSEKIENIVNKKLSKLNKTLNKLNRYSFEETDNDDKATSPISKKGYKKYLESSSKIQKQEKIKGEDKKGKVKAKTAASDLYKSLPKEEKGLAKKYLTKLHKSLKKVALDYDNGEYIGGVDGTIKLSIKDGILSAKFESAHSHGVPFGMDQERILIKNLLSKYDRLDLRTGKQLDKEEISSDKLNIKNICIYNYWDDEENLEEKFNKEIVPKLSSNQIKLLNELNQMIGDADLGPEAHLGFEDGKITFDSGLGDSWENYDAKEDIQNWFDNHEDEINDFSDRNNID